jgi:hypothetical protein
MPSKNLNDGALNEVTELLRRLSTPPRVARLGRRWGEVGDCSCFDGRIGLVDFDGRRGRTKLMIYGFAIIDALAISKTWCLDSIKRESRMEDALCCSGVEEEATKPATGAGRASRPLVIRVHGARAGRSCKLPGSSASQPAVSTRTS